MKPQTKEQMYEFGASEQEAEAALRFFEMLRPALKIKRDNGRIPTTNGDKSVLGFYRTCMDFIKEQTK